MASSCVRDNLLRTRTYARLLMKSNLLAFGHCTQRSRTGLRLHIPRKLDRVVAIWDRRGGQVRISKWLLPYQVTNAKGYLARWPSWNPPARSPRRSSASARLRHRGTGRVRLLPRGRRRQRSRWPSSMFFDSSAPLPELLSRQNWIGPTEPIHLRTLLWSCSSM